MYEHATSKRVASEVEVVPVEETLFITLGPSLSKSLYITSHVDLSQFFLQTVSENNGDIYVSSVDDV